MTITSDVEPGLPLVAGDEASLALILRNLISNAGEVRGRRRRHVEVTAARDESGGVAVLVQDDGPGIDPAEAEALFGLYFRSRSSATAQGSGIGLFVCRRLVEAMGGRTWARAAADRRRRVRVHAAGLAGGGRRVRRGSAGVGGSTDDDGRGHA